MLALFISDLHLQQSHPKTTQAFLDFLQQQAIHARQLYLLGDLFEYWAGDDDMATPYHQQIIQALSAVRKTGVELFWIAGNRDFLVGTEFAKTIGATLLPDPFVATIGKLHVTLSHGDTLCTDDVAYMAFRAQVRDSNWQRNFLSLPLAERKAIIRNLRQNSQQAQRMKSAEIMDVHPNAVAALWSETGTSLMIHGHTHRPARHETHKGQSTYVRYVLPDWEYDANIFPPRGGWIGIEDDGTIKRFGFDGELITSVN